MIRTGTGPARWLAGLGAWAWAMGAPLGAVEWPAVRSLGPGVRTDAAALLLGAPDGATNLRVVVQPLTAGAPSTGRFPYDVVAEIAGEDLLAAAPEEATPGPDGTPRRLLRLELAIYVLEPGGRIRGSVAETLEIDVDRAGIAAAGLRWTTRLALPPGDHRLRLLARVPQTGAVALATRPVRPADGEPRIESARFPASEPAWAVRDLRPPGETPAPPALPVLVPGMRTPVEPPSLAAVTGADAPRMEYASLEDPNRWLPLATHPAAATAAGAPWMIEPPDLGAGGPPIRLRWRAGTAVSDPIDALIAPNAAEGRAVNWTGVAMAMPGSPPDGPAAGPGPGAPAGLSRARGAAFARQFDTVLREWAAAATADAERRTVERLVQAIEEELAGSRRVDPQALADRAFDRLRDLGAAERRSWLAAIDLFDRAYRHAMANRAPAAATFSRRVAFTVTEALAERDPEARPALARFLTGFASAAIAGQGGTDLPRWALERAIQLDPDAVAPRLVAAVEFERRGSSQAAHEVLAPLLAREPRDPEASLRSALARRRARLGSRDAWRRDLEALAATPPAPGEEWIALLALEELRREDHAAAARLPAPAPSEKLLLLDAWEARRRGDRDGARRATDAIRPRAAGEHGERRRFSEAPRALLRREAEVFRAEAEAARSALRRAFGPVAPRAPGGAR